MEPATTVLGGIVIAIISGAVGKTIGTNNNVKKSQCHERQVSCQSLLGQKIENLADKVEILTKAVNSKLLGI